MSASLDPPVALPQTLSEADRPFAQDAAQFLSQYAAAFEALDADAVAALYTEPAVIVDAEGCTHWPDRAAVRANMAALCAHYRARGLQGAKPQLRRVLSQGAACGYVDVQWTLQWAPAQAGDASTPTRFGTGYLLHKTGNDWRVRLCTAYEETL